MNVINKKMNTGVYRSIHQCIEETPTNLKADFIIHYQSFRKTPYINSAFVNSKI